MNVGDILFAPMPDVGNQLILYPAANPSYAVPALNQLIVVLILQLYIPSGNGFLIAKRLDLDLYFLFRFIVLFL